MSCKSAEKWWISTSLQFLACVLAPLVHRKQVPWPWNSLWSVYWYSNTSQCAKYSTVPGIRLRFFPSATDRDIFPPPWHTVLRTNWICTKHYLTSLVFYYLRKWKISGINLLTIKIGNRFFKKCPCFSSHLNFIVLRFTKLSQYEQT